MNLVHPLEDFGAKLNSVQVPSRYLGGEYGSIIKPHSPSDSYFNVGIAFPDLYEIGMSNLAIKIIYNGLNALNDVRCERVFAPDTDFESLLKEKNLPLYTLETGIPLYELDVLAFSIGYELGITEVLAMLDSGKIPLTSDERKNGKYPLIIAGGCGVTNPAPISDFFDAIMIGEAEAGLFPLIQELAEYKKNGFSKAKVFELLNQKSFLWTKEKSKSQKITYRAVQNNFGLTKSVPTWFPLPAVKPVQDHGVVEIMRGCPNGCRFCHAGIYYRPSRVKSVPLIIEEIDHLVFDAGYREISLNSLSSADFPDIDTLLDTLNERYKGYNVSFQLPSLKVNSMSLPILEKISTVRKSGLTFAIETPEESWQLSLNKEVYAQHLESVIKEAKQKGWSSAKFYFMIGLPFGDSEEKVIADFLLDLQKKTRIQCTVNVGLFIPKPHTPYQWVKQLTPEAAEKKMDYLYASLPRGKFKINRHNFDASILEGLFSRGDSRVCKLILAAFKKGVRFDAWDDHLRTNMPIWKEVFSSADWGVFSWIYKTWDLEEKLPWDDVSLGSTKAFFKKEWQKSLSHTLTPRCESECKHPCGICNKTQNITVYSKKTLENTFNCLQNNTIVQPKEYPKSNIPLLYRAVFTFSRQNGGEYTAYLSQVEIFHKAILRTKLPFVFTVGFNPLPRLEFATALTLGLPSIEEVGSCLLYENISPDVFLEQMNKVLPQFFRLKEILIFPVTNLRKREALSQSLWGGIYSYQFFSDLNCAEFLALPKTKEFLCNTEYSVTDSTTITLKLPVSDKAFRKLLEDYFEKKWYEIVQIKKLSTLAKPQIDGWTAEDEENWRLNNKSFSKTNTKIIDEKPISFIELYTKIAAVNKELIQKRESLTKKQIEFYAEHPDLKEKRQNS